MKLTIELFKNYNLIESNLLNYGLVIRKCTNCIITNNTMYKSVLKELFVLDNNKD